MSTPRLPPEDLSSAALAGVALILAGPDLGGVRIGGEETVARAWMEALLRLAAAVEAADGGPGPVRRLGRSASVEAVCGGLDLGLTLLTHRRVLQTGLLAQADGGWLVATRLSGVEPTVMAALCEALDLGVVRTLRDGLAQERPARVRLLALDPDQTCPGALAERLALRVEADDAGLAELDALTARAKDLAVARRRLARVRLDAGHRVAIARFGLDTGRTSLRAAIACTDVVRAMAALNGSARTQAQDVERAHRLLFGQAHEAAATPPPVEPTPPPPLRDGGQDARASGAPATSEAPDGARPPQAAAPLPSDMLEIAAQGRPHRRTGASGRGGVPARTHGTQGAPAGWRRRSGERRGLDLVQTLKAAAPLQPLRRGFPGAAAADARLLVHPGDFRQSIRRPRPRTTCVFVVDGSGSAAAERLAEAKGAVEQLLARCYARRDRVAVVQFRGMEAQVVLAPTRGAARARRLLAELPAGGATPLASGILAGADLALAAQARGETALVVLLTDGRANVNRQGLAGREGAIRDAHAAAQTLAGSGVASLLIDISPRGAREAERLAESLHARRLHLPHLQATGLAANVELMRRMAAQAAP